MDHLKCASSNKLQHMFNQTSTQEPLGVKFKPFGIEPGLVKQVREKFQSEIAIHELPSNLPNDSKRHSATARLAYAYENYLSSEKSKIRHNTFPNRRSSSVSHFGEKIIPNPAVPIRPREKHGDRLLTSLGMTCGNTVVSGHTKDGDNQAQIVNEIDNKPSVASKRRLFENYYRPSNIGLFSSFQYQNRNNLTSYAVRQMSNSEQKLNENSHSKPVIYPTLKPKALLPTNIQRRYPNSVNDLTLNTAYRSSIMTPTCFTLTKLLESKLVDSAENTNGEILSDQNKSSKPNENACELKPSLKKELSASSLKLVSPYQATSQENYNPNLFMLKNKTNSENPLQIAHETIKRNSSLRESSNFRSPFSPQSQTFDSINLNSSEKKSAINCNERNSSTITKSQATYPLSCDHSPKLMVQPINFENKNSYMAESKFSPGILSPMASLFGSPPEIASPSADIKLNGVISSQRPNVVMNNNIQNSNGLNNHKNSAILPKLGINSSLDTDLYENSCADSKNDKHYSNSDTNSQKHFSKASLIGSQAAKKSFCEQNSSSIDEKTDTNENSKNSNLGETKSEKKINKISDCSNNNCSSDLNDRKPQRCFSSYISPSNRVAESLYKRQSVCPALMNVMDEMQQLFAGAVSNSAKGLKIHDFAQQKALQCKEEQQNKLEQNSQLINNSKMVNDCENKNNSTSQCQSDEKESLALNSPSVTSKSKDWSASFREAYVAMEKNLKLPFLHKAKDQVMQLKNSGNRRENSFDNSKLTEKKPIKSILRPKSVEPYSVSGKFSNYDYHLLDFTLAVKCFKGIKHP